MTVKTKKRKTLKQIDLSYLKVLNSTMGEWKSKEDDKAYKNL